MWRFRAVSRRVTNALSHRQAAIALGTGAASAPLAGCHSDAARVRCHSDTAHSHATVADYDMASGFQTAALGATFLASAAPALCAVHCAAMPVLTVLLPTLSIGSRFGCMHSVARKIALYFVAPFGLIANAVGYPQHQSEAIVAVNLTGVSSVVAAALYSPIAPYRNWFNLGGCALMLSSQYYGNKIASERGTGCGGCGHHHH